MKGMTIRQEKIWQKKMVELEKAILRYFYKPEVTVDDPDRVEKPDGSFAMSAFKAGYYLRGRKRG